MRAIQAPAGGPGTLQPDSRVVWREPQEVALDLALTPSTW